MTPTGQKDFSDSKDNKDSYDCTENIDRISINLFRDNIELLTKVTLLMVVIVSILTSN